MPTDDERRRVARNVRENYIRGGMGCRTASTYNIALAVGIVPEMLVEDIEFWNRLADLIDPDCDASATHTDVTTTREVSQSRRSDVDPTERGIDSIYDWCFSGLEGSDEDEDELYCAIMRAIEDYRHPERAAARTVRPVDRGALLMLEGCVRKMGEGYDKVGAFGIGTTLSAISDRIREACGEAVE